MSLVTSSSYSSLKDSNTFLEVIVISEMVLVLGSTILKVWDLGPKVGDSRSVESVESVDGESIWRGERSWMRLPLLLSVSHSESNWMR